MVIQGEDKDGTGLLKQKQIGDEGEEVWHDAEEEFSENLEVATLSVHAMEGIQNINKSN